MKGTLNFSDFFSKAINKSFRTYKERFINCSSEFSEKIVHDLRVSIRKFLSLHLLLCNITNSVYSEDLKKQMKQQLKMLNLLRDTQVQIILIRKLLPKYPVLDRFLGLLLYTENDTVNKIYPRLAKFDIDEIEGLAVFYRFEIKKKLSDIEGVKSEILNTIDSYYSLICDLKDKIDKDNPETIHKLRLAFKKFRYTIEALEPIINISKHDLKVLHSFQTVMGKIQDSCVIERNLLSYIDNQILIPKEKFNDVTKEILRQRELLIYSFMNRINIPSNFWESKRSNFFKGI